MGNPRIVLALTLACAFALGAVVLVAIERDDDGPADAAQGRVPGVEGPGDRFAGATLPAKVRAPEFELRNQDGERIAMRALRGRPAIVTFLYTTCEETCPGQAQQIKGGLDRLGHELPVLAIAVDPPRDTEASARRFLFEQGMSGRMDFVLGSRAQLAPLWRAYGIQPQSDDAEHQARIVLVDRRGFQRVGFPLEQATPERIAHDVAVLERE